MTQRASKILPKTEDRYMQMVREYIDGRTFEDLAKQFYLSRPGIIDAFERMKRKYGAVNTPNLIAILFRQGKIS